MSELILHHYDISPFAEKIRLILGYKRLDWHSVIQPMVLPKPQLVPLTGGFRRIPVLQVGADVYCDTLRIAEELDRRFPDPPLFPEGRSGLAHVLMTWAEQVLMWPTARYVTAVNSHRLPPGFHADRAAMRGHAPPTEEALRASIPHHRAQLAIELSWLEELLGDGRPFLTSRAPCLGDFAVYQRLWWLHAFDGAATDVLEPHRTLRSWMGRMAALGHGRRRELDPEAALDIARDASPAALDDRQIAADGRIAIVATEGFGPDAVAGALVAESVHGLALRRADPRVGTVVVHFPRLGYEVRPPAE